LQQCQIVLVVVLVLVIEVGEFEDEDDDENEDEGFCAGSSPHPYLDPGSGFGAGGRIPHSDAVAAFRQPGDFAGAFPVEPE